MSFFWSQASDTPQAQTDMALRRAARCQPSAVRPAFCYDHVPLTTKQALLKKNSQLVLVRDTRRLVAGICVGIPEHYLCASGPRCRGSDAACAPQPRCRQSPCRCAPARPQTPPRPRPASRRRRQTLTPPALAPLPGPPAARMAARLPRAGVPLPCTPHLRGVSLHASRQTM